MIEAKTKQEAAAPADKNLPLCKGMKLVRYDRKKDTPETIAQNEDNNAAWRAACEKAKK